MSRGGLYFVDGNAWAVGTKIECVIQLPLKAFSGRPVEIKCVGRILRIVPQEGGGIGVGAAIESYRFLVSEENVGATG